ncbi:DUF2059 domain-containing protein [Bradyrhizobium sp.]|uniref:DUF2059 domain-containing protein n=1 Tax=Bradyrhizobium sp. TaxID=376 RepID=UPI003C717069
MKSLSRILSAAGLLLGLALAAVPAGAQQPAPQPPAAPLKPASPAAIAAAKELLTLKGVGGIYTAAVPNLVQRAKDQLLASNLNYQKDLNEVAVIVAQSLAGREKEIGEQMAKIYASDFTEQELKDLNAFYKTPVGQKLLAQEPKSVQASMAYMQQWAQSFSETVMGEFRSEMKKRGKPIS